MTIKLLDSAIKAAGNKSQLADRLGTSRQLIQLWQIRKAVPKKWVESVKRIAKEAR
jgi:hypothetical protein